MSEELAIISRIIEWHRTIREHVKLVGESIADREALSSLQRTRADWVPGQLDILAKKQNKLQQAISSLDDGLRNHFGWEEKVLPPIFGELLMRALRLDHKSVLKEVGEAREMFADINLEGLKREELLIKESDIQQVVESLSQIVEEHAAREEVILEMLQRGLQDRNHNG